MTIKLVQVQVLLPVLALALGAIPSRSQSREPCPKLGEPSHVHLQFVEPRTQLCLTLPAGWVQQVQIDSQIPGLHWHSLPGGGSLVLDVTPLPASVSREPVVEAAETLRLMYKRRAGYTVYPGKRLQMDGRHAERLDVTAADGGTLRIVVIGVEKHAFALTFGGGQDPDGAERTLDELLESVRFF